MKCDELKNYDVHGARLPAMPGKGEFVKRADVDAAIAELKSENERLNRELEHVKNGDCINTCDVVEKHVKEEIKAKRALWLARAERYKMREFIAREEANLVNQMSWSQILRERTYNQWVGQLLRIANLANKLQNKCLAKAEEYK